MALARTALRLACLFLLFTAAGLVCRAEAAAYPGFRSLGIWQEGDGLRLDLGVWYPVSRPPSSARYGDWTLQVNRRAKPMEGRFPLVVISHGSAGNRFAHHDLAAALASRGFVVVAPTHKGDNLQNMDFVFTDRQLTERLRELRHTLDTICADPDIGPHIDANRIGLIGFGSGGSAALLAAGGRVSRQAWERWKASAPPDAPYKNPWNLKRLDSIVENPELPRLQADPRLRAVAVVTPAHSMFFDAGSLARIRVPLLLLAVGRDRLNPAPEYLSGLAKALPEVPRTGMLAEATPLALMARPSGDVSGVLPGYVPPSQRQHAAISEALIRDVTQFFLDTIGDPNLPPPPPALPDDTLAAEPAPAPPPDPAPKSKARPKAKKKRS